MKRCPRCKIIFHLDDRTHCLYCEAMLHNVSSEEENSLQRSSSIGGIQSVPPIIQQILKDYKTEYLGQMQMIMGSYFRARTFHFIYNFCRNDLKMGKIYKRFLIQPLGPASFLMIPWVVYDFGDSLLFRVAYNGFCQQCQWKYKKIAAEHNPKECDYNREYKALMEDIMSGKIAKTEVDFKRLAIKKMKVGQSSAYNDLCAMRNSLEGFLDIFCVWFSICLLIGVTVAITLPTISKLIIDLDLSK